MDDRLAGMWRKLHRAKVHVDMLREAVRDPTNGDPRSIDLVRRFDPDEKAVIAYAERVPKILDCYGVVVGDAIHNLRCALDHLWWQLAISHLRREPTRDEAKDIQFPILSDSKYLDDSKWLAHRFMQHVSRSAAMEAKAIQPFMEPRRDEPDTVDALEALANLSNTDKHRVVNVVVAVPHEATFRLPRPQDFVDCAGVFRPSSAPGEFEGTVRLHTKETISVGDPVIEVAVIQTGPNPDVDLDPKLSCFIAIKTEEGHKLDMLEYLEQVGAGIVASISSFEPLL